MSLIPHLPYLRRYARALTGSQSSGDEYVRACLEAILESDDLIDKSLSPRVALYRAFRSIWVSANPGDKAAPVASTQERSSLPQLDLLTPTHRQALLLTAMEGFTESEAAKVLDCAPQDVPAMIDKALQEITAQNPVPVLIIEDEAVISLDLQRIVEEMGHFVTTIAATRREAVAAAHKQKPGLILADIQLADNSSGVDAINDILRGITAPVIFITAFPERLLTGERPEPTFLITKPFVQNNVKAAIAQALFMSMEDAAPRKISA
jgi:DNA-directed RNA polymerase specialized sigma24 family protein/CheY-like chemotaxis protein